MLCLSRKLFQSIVIGTGADAVVVTVVDIDRNKIRLGIQARRDLPVWRAELLPLRPEPGPVPAAEGSAS